MQPRCSQQAPSCASRAISIPPANRNVPDGRNWSGLGHRSIDQMMISLAQGSYLTEEQFAEELAQRREDLNLTAGQYVVVARPVATPRSRHRRARTNSRKMTPKMRVCGVLGVGCWWQSWSWPCHRFGRRWPPRPGRTSLPPTRGGKGTRTDRSICRSATSTATGRADRSPSWPEQYHRAGRTRPGAANPLYPRRNRFVFRDPGPCGLRRQGTGVDLTQQRGDRTGVCHAADRLLCR